MHHSAHDIFLQAVAAYQEKDFKKAGILCRTVLESNPHHAACLHLIGVMAYKEGRMEEAEALMRQSLEIHSSFAEMHYSFAHVLFAQSKWVEAVEAYRHTLEINPEHRGAWYALGKTLQNLGQNDEAEQAYTQALALKADDHQCLNALGILYCGQKKYIDARDCFSRALALQPASAELLNNLSVVSYALGTYAEALHYSERALALRPRYTAALTNRGNVYKAQGENDKAAAAYRQALELDPQSVEARNNLGLIYLHALSDMKAAEECFRHILSQDPHYIPALTHLGIVLCQQGLFVDGKACYEKALSLQPHDREALNNLGNALRALGQLPQAIEAYERVVDMDPEDAEAHHNLAMALLMAGRFDRGWHEYENRWRTSQLAAARRNFSQPQWYGEKAKGQTLLIHAEQGFGDTLQFCRYAELAAARGLRIIVEVQPELQRLMQTLTGVEKVISRGDVLPTFDLHCPMMSLPLACATHIETIPATIPYLWPATDLVMEWKKRLEGSTCLKVGIAWAGNPRLFSIDLAAANRRRSLSSEALAHLIHDLPVTFYSLQKEGPSLGSNLPIIDWMSLCRDFADTAALVASLDLVISVDSAVAHLSAALGKPVWLLNRYDSCWRWLTARDDSPWYPTLRLFHQTYPGDWGTVIESIRHELKRMADR